ncbi:NERD domain-containing protein [Endozoicomonas sp. YOMI1]|uniref:NERD domain-containing protein n=1 Tax=Endozoicomonas sp. YOMI1 TaxID=2828739 RepID=UPI002148094D|nr:NERD domain-containing protein [Endozoicomonas sp. YOMI1]
MKIIPNIPYNNNSFAEGQVFDALKLAKLEGINIIAFHSLALTSHTDKREGEADFVIISTFGLFVLEVKGGRISFQDGIWFTENKHGKHRISDPFKQANGAVHAVNKKIKEFLNLEETRIPIGYAVMFPNVVWKQQGAEWDREMICDSADIRHFDHWLTNLFKYWNYRRPANANLLSTDDVNQIASFLRPNFEVVQPLFDQIESVNRSSVCLTEEQYHYVDMAMENKRVMCSGGAGTGKTFLAAEMARRFIAQDKTVLLACKSSWLRHYLTTRIESEKLLISTINGLSTALRRSGLDAFDVLIVDEGQDLLNRSDLDILDSAITGGLDDGQWYFFHDANNQADVLSHMDKDALGWLKTKNNPAVLRLNVNCRNTGNILTSIQTSLGCDMGKPTLVEGPEVTEHHGSKESLANDLSKLLKELKSSEVDERSITILSSVRKRRSLLSVLAQDEINSITELDDYKVRKYPFDGITFAEIKNFKGLENDIIILLDLPNPNSLSNSDNRSLHYVGMSRAKAKLYCFWC